MPEYKIITEPLEPVIFDMFDFIKEWLNRD